MLADKRIKGLAKIVSRGEKRKALQYVHVIGDSATEATDGHILAKARFEPGGDEYPEVYGDDVSFPESDVYLTVEQIDKAFAALPKRMRIPCLSNILVGERDGKGVAIGTDGNNTMIAANSVENSECAYPETERLWEREEGEEEEPMYLRFRIDILEKLLTLMKHVRGDEKDFVNVVMEVRGDDNAVRFLVNNMGNVEYKGVVMQMMRKDEDIERWSEEFKEY